jgi:hypothetical protein
MADGANGQGAAAPNPSGASRAAVPALDQPDERDEAAHALRR